MGEYPMSKNDAIFRFPALSGLADPGRIANMPDSDIMELLPSALRQDGGDVNALYIIKRALGIYAEANGAYRQHAIEQQCEIATLKLQAAWIPVTDPAGVPDHKYGDYRRRGSPLDPTVAG